MAFESNRAPTVVVGETDPSGTGDDVLTVTGMGNGSLDTSSDGYVTVDGASFRYPNSKLALANGGLLLVATVGSRCAGQCSAAAAGGPATLVFVPAPTPTDEAGNPATGTLAVVDFRLF